MSRPWRGRLSGVGRPLRIDIQRSDLYWPAQLAVLAAIVLYLTLPNELTIGPAWLIPAIEVTLFVAFVLTTPGEEAPRTQVRQRVAWALVGVLVVATLVGLGLLAHLIVKEGTQAGGGYFERHSSSGAQSCSRSRSSTRNSIGGSGCARTAGPHSAS